MDPVLTLHLHGQDYLTLMRTTEPLLFKVGPEELLVEAQAGTYLSFFRCLDDALPPCKIVTVPTKETSVDIWLLT